MKITPIHADVSGAVQYRYSRLYPENLSLSDPYAQVDRVTRLREYCLMLCGIERDRIPQSREEHEHMFPTGKRSQARRSGHLSMREVSNELGLAFTTFRMWCDYDLIKRGRPTVLQRDPLEIPFRLLLLIAPQDLPSTGHIVRMMKLPKHMIDWSAYDLHYWLVTGLNPPASISAHTRYTEDVPSEFLGALSRIRSSEDWLQNLRLMLNVMPRDQALVETAHQMIEERTQEQLTISVDWECIEKLITGNIERTGMRGVHDLDEMWNSVAKLQLDESEQVFNVFTSLMDHTAGAEVFGCSNVITYVTRLLACRVDEFLSCVRYTHDHNSNASVPG